MLSYRAVGLPSHVVSWQQLHGGLRNSAETQSAGVASRFLHLMDQPYLTGAASRASSAL